ncbi:MAG: hypothetical protein E7317_12970 [Clostridiales bacterium]|nr:hypothetical protein [Clostridiales bacterium]
MLKKTERGADIMCDKAKLIFDGGIAVGKADAVISIMRSTGWDLAKAMEIAGVKEDDRPEMEALVRERMARTA